MLEEGFFLKKNDEGKKQRARERELAEFDEKMIYDVYGITSIVFP